MDEKLYTPQEVSDILKIKKTTVYEMIKKGTIDAVKIGKHIRVSESNLNAFLGMSNGGSSGNNAVVAPLHDHINDFPHIMNNSGNIVVCGQDVVLDVLCSATGSAINNNCFLRSYLGSTNGLIALYNREVSVTACHLWDRESDLYNLPFVNALLPGVGVSIYHLFNRPVCIYVQKGNPKNITSIKDFARSNVCIVNRELGSGIRVLVDSLLQEYEISTDAIKGYNKIINSHLAAASAVSRGDADCAIGMENASYQFANIETIFLRNEQYDLVIRKDDEKRFELVNLVNVLKSEKFKESVNSMGCYDTKNMGVKLK
ncbi:MAG: substrate-binding domain-containing protein [Lachnospirales bacterium]